MTSTGLALRYAAFAVLATIANLGTQRLIMLDSAWPGSYPVAVAAGTVIGLAAKYVLDSHWIFPATDGNPARHGQQFILYSATGVATTLVFWASETAFWLLWQTQMAREIGAVTGLAIGYVAKYRLDRRYVFGRAPGAAA